MKGAKCYECGFVGWADAEICKKCGAQMIADSVEGAYQPRPARPAYQGEPAANLSKSLATWSLVLGIASFLTMGLFGILATVGVVLGIIALVKTSQNPLHYGGKGRAIGGLILSSVSAIAVPFAIIAAIAIPNLLAARRAANESASISTLRRISLAQSTYQGQHGTYGDLNALASEKLIDPDLVSGPRYGYTFTTTAHPDPAAFETTAVPVSYPNTGMRSFYIDETGVIRAADRHGAEATRLDAPLQTDSYSNPYRRTADTHSYDEDDR